nr:hypothetical protein [Kibdelosporangium sp. MJ126-NF4]
MNTDTALTTRRCSRFPVPLTSTVEGADSDRVNTPRDEPVI